MSKSAAKILALALALMMLFAVATGCSKSEPATSDDGTQGDTPSTDVDQPSGDDQTPEEPTYDFGGRTVKMSAWWDLEPVAGSSEGADKQIARRQEMMDKWNFKFEYLNIPYDQYLEQFTASTLAGEPFSDLAEVASGWFFPGLVANGFLAPLDDLGVFDFNDEKWTKATIDYATYDGKIYGMGAGQFFPRSGMFWNKTMFEREGLPNVYDLVNDKTWTWDKMLEIAKKATKDLDGDGIIDQWGIESQDMEWQLVASNGGYFVKPDGQGAKFGLGEPAAQEALQYYQDLYNVHKVVELPPDGSAWDYPGQQFQDGKAAMLAYQWWFVDRLQPNMVDDYGWVPFPMGPKMDKYVSVATETNLTVIPATVTKPEEVALVEDRITDPFPDEDPEAWREYPESKARDEETVDMYKNWDLWDLTTMEYYGSFPDVTNLSYGFMWQIRTGNQTPQVAIQEVAAQAQSILDDAFKKQQ